MKRLNDCSKYPEAINTKAFPLRIVEETRKMDFNKKHGDGHDVGGLIDDERRYA
jgi:hypothetical protein